MEEAMKMRNLLQEFLKKHDGIRHPSILGLREHIFTGRQILSFSLLIHYFFNFASHGQFCAFFIDLLASECSVSSLAWFMSNQETSFVTIGQRLLANPLK